MKQRTADPYRQLDVIDSRAPRFSQATLGLLLVVAFAVDWWPLVAFLAAQWAIGLVFGRRYCLPCLLYFEVVQRLVGEGPIEDARPPRFANLVGAVFLSAAALAHAADYRALGWAVALLVAALALLAAATNICVACEIYRFAARLRGVRSHRLDRIDPADVGGLAESEVVVEFAHPLCTECHALEEKLRSEGRSVVAVDVSKRPELARKYGVTVVPTAVAVAPNGVVTGRVAG